MFGLSGFAAAPFASSGITISGGWVPVNSNQIGAWSSVGEDVVNLLTCLTTQSSDGLTTEDGVLIATGVSTSQPLVSNWADISQSQTPNWTNI